jgi:16S rRNA (uracil1498-N3)-methyltransferase
MREAELALFCYEQAKTPLREVLDGAKPQSAALLIGSEGGFSPEEAAAAEAQGVAPVSLGSRILRCETAPIAAVAALLYALGEM